MPTETASVPQTPVVLLIAGLFTGMLKNWQATAFGDLVHAGIAKPVAHKIATDFGSDLGRLMSSEAGKSFKSKIGKLDADGNRKIGMAGKATIKTSNSMSVVYVCQTMDSLFAEELLASRELPELSADLQDYLAECEDWASKQQWKK